MLEKIISGGQTGADRAALDVALKLGIPHGGWVPKGRIAQDGLLAPKYRVQQMPTTSYPARTEQNVADSDGTVIFFRGKLTGGSDYTREMALKHRKQMLGIDLSRTNHKDGASLIASWIKLYRVKVLNVAGSSASKDPGMYAEVAIILENVLQMLIADERRPVIVPETRETAQSSPQPQTVAEVVVLLTSEMKLKDKSLIAAMSEESLIDLYPSLGVYIRNRYLYPRNEKLLEACRSTAMDKYLHWDQASLVIIKELWKRLQETHRLRLVKD
jgi:hypothetical protein